MQSANWYVFWFAVVASFGPLHPSVARDSVQGEADDLVERGRYLAAAGNCVSCHTRSGAPPFSGGVAFETPLGTIYSTNITPDPTHGIGKWTGADFKRAMHEGIAPGGRRLFPAFPYTSYTNVSDADVAAIYAFLRTVAPVKATPPANDWIFSMRWAMRFWNMLNFKPQRYQADLSQTPEWNRGAYLVKGLGHCGACHTGRDWMQAEVDGRFLQGGVIAHEVTPNTVRNWSAVNLTSSIDGLKSWSVNDLTSYLHTGVSRRAGAFGPMNEAIVNGTSKLTRDDVRAMAVYIKSLPAAETRSPTIPAEEVKKGASIYEEHCEECHASSGRGGPFGGPPLAGSAIVQAENPASLFNVLLYAATPPKEIAVGQWETMPAYGDKLTDEDIASVANYVRGSWGNVGRLVTASEVRAQRE